MAREIVLDTETTGLDPKSGHRVIEIACIEIEDYLPTGRNFHRFIDPQRDIDPEAEKVHGISRRSLLGKPTFDHEDICDAFLDFVGDAPVVAHNAAFDRGFINHELEQAGRRTVPTAPVGLHLGAGQDAVSGDVQFPSTPCVSGSRFPWPSEKSTGR